MILNGYQSHGLDKLLTPSVLDTAPSDALVSLSELLANYSPDQERDERGRFASGGGGGGKSKDEGAGGDTGGSSYTPSRSTFAPPSQDVMKSSFVARSLGAAAGRSEKAVQAGVELAMETVGKSVYESLPHPLQKVIDIAAEVDDKVGGYYDAGQRLAKEMAIERNLKVRDVAAVGRVLARSDAFLGHVGDAFGVQLGKYFPLASLSYTAYSMARGALSGRNPFTMVTAALDRVHQSLKGNHGY